MPLNICGLPSLHSCVGSFAQSPTYPAAGVGPTWTHGGRSSPAASTAVMTVARAALKKILNGDSMDCSVPSATRKCQPIRFRSLVCRVPRGNVPPAAPRAGPRTRTGTPPGDCGCSPVRVLVCGVSRVCPVPVPCIFRPRTGSKVWSMFWTLVFTGILDL